LEKGVRGIGEKGAEAFKGRRSLIGVESEGSGDGRIFQ
jgi:hypothetical protein